MVRMRQRRRTRKPLVTTHISSSTDWKRPLSAVAMVCVVWAVVTAVWWMWEACDQPVIPVPISLSNQLNRLAFQGNVGEVKRLVERHSEMDWTALGTRGGGEVGGGGGGELTAIHHALHGRHLSLTTQSQELKGSHEVSPWHDYQSPHSSSYPYCRRSSRTSLTIFTGTQTSAARFTMQSTSATSLR